ncbi:MAG: efflux RND transporter permease subunit [Polyangiales bacterium]
MIKRFIHRPVLAIVVSLLLIFLGALAIRSRPVSQFPEIAPPLVTVTLAYPGASARVLIEAALIPLERSINGVPGMRYMVSDATSAGEATIQVVFEPGIDPDIAVVNVKNRVDQSINQIPELVRLEGVVVTRLQPSMLMYVNLYSTDPNANETYLYNFASVNLIPELQRISGVGRATILGNRTFAMRVWLKPDRMRAYNVSTEEVMRAIADQSVIGRPGRTGSATGMASQSLEYVLVYQGRYDQAEQYANIVIRATTNGEILRLRDVADVRLGSEFFDIYSNLDGHPSAAIVLKQSPGTNAREVIAEVRGLLEQLQRTRFPPRMHYSVNYDVSQFLDASIEKVLHTLLEAFALVALVVFVFLGDWRSTLVPTLAVPVSLIGSFIFMQVFDLTINLITLFALVLAIGIVVDDAIVVVEAVHAKMAEAPSLTPYEAVKQVIGEISGAIIAITLLMAAVFVPVAFMTGPVGVFYRQFSITMASSIVLSGVVALTLTPVLCAIILKKHEHGAHKRRTPITLFFDLFNRAFDRATSRYVRFLEVFVNRRVVTFLILALFGFGIFQVNRGLPAGFVPNEDQGQIYAIIQTPPGATLERTNQVSRDLQEVARHVEGVESVSSLAATRSSRGPRLERRDVPHQPPAVVAAPPLGAPGHRGARGALARHRRARRVLRTAVGAGFGAADGFALRLLDLSETTDYNEFDRVNREFMQHLERRPELAGLFTFFAANYPQYELVIDNELAMQKGVSIRAALDNLDILIGSTYEQGFIRFGRFYKVYVQALPQYRRLPSDILNLFVKNSRDEMVPYSAFMTMRETHGPNEITRYNLYNSSAIRGVPAPGYTSGDAIRAIREVARQTLPRGYDIAWEGLSFDEARRGNEAIYIFVIVVAFVYLVLAAQYESFIIPLSVLLSLPMGIFGSFLLLRALGLANDIYAQVALVMLVGLLGKNAVLIVEYAVQRHHGGLSIRDAAIEGARARFRPILMTSFAFIAGLIPLVRATGPGAVGNRTIGTAALGGMLFGTVFGVAVIPGLYYIFGTLAEGRSLIRQEEELPVTEGNEFTEPARRDDHSQPRRRMARWKLPRESQVELTQVDAAERDAAETGLAGTGVATPASRRPPRRSPARTRTETRPSPETVRPMRSAAPRSHGARAPALARRRGGARGCIPTTAAPRARPVARCPTPSASKPTRSTRRASTGGPSSPTRTSSRSSTSRCRTTRS